MSFRGAQVRVSDSALTVFYSTQVDILDCRGHEKEMEQGDPMLRSRSTSTG